MVKRFQCPVLPSSPPFPNTQHASDGQIHSLQGDALNANFSIQLRTDFSVELKQKACSNVDSKRDQRD